MNNKITALIQESIAIVQAQGIRIVKGPWFDFTGENGKIIGCDPIGAVILAKEAMPAGINPFDCATLVRPGFIKVACELLNVDPSWLQRFWMGFDRGHQVTLIDDKDKEHRDDISAYGIQLAKQLKI